VAFYTIAHLLLGKDNFSGTKPSPLGISANQLTDEVFSYIFGHDIPPPVKSGISHDNLTLLRTEFTTFYPVKLRVSGKDLIPNHLVFWIYNHVALFPKKFWPTGVKGNGWLLLNGDKMAKRAGNFITIEDGISRYGADGMRFALAEAGDTLDDPNFTTENADNAILRIHTFLEWAKEMVSLPDTPPAPFGWEEKVLVAKIGNAISECTKAYNALHFREVCVHCYDLLSARDFYRNFVKAKNKPIHKPLIVRFVRVFVQLMAPISSHTSEHMWKHLLGESRTIFDSKWPTCTDLEPEAGSTLLREGFYIQQCIASWRSKVTGTKAMIQVANSYLPWMVEARKIVQTLFTEKAGQFPEMSEVSKAVSANSVTSPHTKKAISLCANIKADFSVRGDIALSVPPVLPEKSLLEHAIPFIESSLGITVVEIVVVENSATTTPGNPALLFQ